MKYTFNNRLLACAFAGAALGLNKNSNWDYDCDNQADNFLGIPGAGPVTIEISLEDEIFSIFTSTRDKDTPTVTTLAQLETALGAVRALVSGPRESDGEVAFRMSENKGNAIGYTFAIYKDGSVEVGCQFYSPKEADQLVALARTYLKSGKLKATTIGGEFKVFVYDRKTKTLAINDGRIQAKNILALEALRRKHATARQPQVKAEPIHLFGATRKARKK